MSTKRSRNGAPPVEKVWNDASSCAPVVDAEGPRTGERNARLMRYLLSGLF
jgi:hypothetical protein